MCNGQGDQPNRNPPPQSGDTQPEKTGERRITAGTIRLNAKEALFFAPDSDHSARIGSKKFAVFFAVEEDSGTVGEDKKHRLRELNRDGKYIKLKWCNASKCLFFAALSAAAKGLKVDIIVDEEFRITDITVPAR